MLHWPHTLVPIGPSLCLHLFATQPGLASFACNHAGHTAKPTTLVLAGGEGKKAKKRHAEGTPGVTAAAGGAEALAARWVLRGKVRGARLSGQHIDSI